MTTKAELAAQLAACRRELAERRRVGELMRAYLRVYAEIPSRPVRVEWDAIAREGGEGGS
jgi:hypothetical protein